MLTHLYIRNFVLVTESEIEFQAGMTVLSGETGAGKSIIFDALGLAIGKRSENRFIRKGSDQAEIAATFEQLTPEIEHWLDQQALEADEDTLILRRVLRRDGRSRAFINGTPCTTQQLKALSTLLIDIQGQHAHQRLLKRDEQLHLLDRYGQHQQLLEQMTRAYRQYEALRQQLAQLQQSEQERRDRIALLQFQLEELNTLAIEEGELPQLEEEQQRLSNGEQLLELSHHALQLLNGEENEENAIQQLHRTLNQLSSLQPLDPTIQPLREQLLEATCQAEECARELEHHSSQHYTLDPQRLQWLNQRLATFSDLARKHHCKPELLFEHQQQLQLQLEQLLNTSTTLESLQQQLAEATTQCQQHADKLHRKRTTAATALQREVTAEIQQLGMEQGALKIVIEPLAEGLFRSSGADEVTFEVETNAGSGYHPLARIASGGELSRISLAIQLASANRGHTPTLIFDEVDSGVGGGTAERIGQKLRQLGEATQILCVTHLPQVASQGHQHLAIRKQSAGDGNTTHSQVTPLGEEARTEEIARMLGGVEITEQTLAHAREMLGAA